MTTGRATSPRTDVTRHLMLIGGKASESSDGRFIDIENPANRTPIGQVPRATGTDVDTAVRAAAAAFETWRLVAPRDRGRMLLKIADAVETEVEPLARILDLETAQTVMRVGKRCAEHDAATRKLPDQGVRIRHMDKGIPTGHRMTPRVG